MELGLYPVGMVMYPAEHLHAIVTGQNIIGTQIPFAAPTPPDTTGVTSSTPADATTRSSSWRS